MTESDDGARADEAEVRERIERYVDELRAAGAIRSPRVERAFRTVPRTGCSRRSTTGARRAGSRSTTIPGTRAGIISS